jgi:hypothetical protein
MLIQLLNSARAGPAIEVSQSDADDPFPPLVCASFGSVGEGLPQQRTSVFYLTVTCIRRPKIGHHSHALRYEGAIDLPKAVVDRIDRRGRIFKQQIAASPEARELTRSEAVEKSAPIALVHDGKRILAGVEITKACRLVLEQRMNFRPPGQDEGSQRREPRTDSYQPLIQDLKSKGWIGAPPSVLDSRVEGAATCQGQAEDVPVAALSSQSLRVTPVHGCIAVAWARRKPGWISSVTITSLSTESAWVASWR